MLVCWEEELGKGRRAGDSGAERARDLEKSLGVAAEGVDSMGTLSSSPESLCLALGHRMLLGLPRKPSLEPGLWRNQHISYSCGGLDPCWVPEPSQTRRDASEGPRWGRGGEDYTWEVGIWPKAGGVWPSG